MEKLCLYARDALLEQITQLLGEEADSISDGRAMADYLKTCLDEYTANGCKAPEQGEAFAVASTSESKEIDETKFLGNVNNDTEISRITGAGATASFPSTGDW